MKELRVGVVVLGLILVFLGILVIHYELNREDEINYTLHDGAMYEYIVNGTTVSSFENRGIEVTTTKDNSLNPFLLFFIDVSIIGYLLIKRSDSYHD